MFETKEQPATDEKLQKKIIRQLRAVRFWLGFFCITMIVGFAIMGFLVYRAMSLFSDTSQQLQGIQSKTSETLKAKDTLCNNALVANSTYCKN